MWKIHRSETLAFDADEWAPKVLRLFQFYLGDQQTAESLTIDTFAEAVRSRDAVTPGGIPVGLLRRAVTKAERAKNGAVQSDPLLLAVSALTPSERAALVLFRGVGLNLEAISAVTSIELSKLKALITNAVLSVQRLVSELTTLHPRKDNECE